MTEEKTLEIINKIFLMIFNQKNKNSLPELLEKFAFDLKLPQSVQDSTTGETTWASSINPTKYITLKNMEMKDITTGWMIDKRNISSLQDIIDIWNSINLTTTERIYDSLAVSESDTIYGCENVYRSTDCRQSKNIIFCDSCGTSEFLLACQRTASSQFCIRTDDSKNCSNSYSVICSNKISNSLFIQDCFDLHECIFCSHIASKRYCIANMQFEKEEYFEIKKAIIDWILSS